MLRKELRLIGEDRFFLEMVWNGKYTAKRLLTAFGVRPPFFLEGAPDEAYYILLGVCITRELQKRVKLPQWNNVEDAVQLLKGAKNIVVLTGAGVGLAIGPFLGTLHDVCHDHAESTTLTLALILCGLRRPF